MVKSCYMVNSRLTGVYMVKSCYMVNSNKVLHGKELLHGKE